MPIPAELESVLRSRKLDHTLARHFDEPVPLDPRWVMPTGMAEIDRRLDGGLPRGQLSEIVGPRSSGRFTVLVSMIAAATRRGEAVALVDPLDMFDPVSASATGIDFARLLWVRGEATSSARVSLSCEYGTLQKAVDRAVKALNLVLQAGGFGLVALDFGEVAAQAVKRLPFTTWLRLHRVIEGSETACVLVGGQPIARSARGLTLQLSRLATTPLQPEAYALSARVIRSRAVDVDRDVCVPVSAAAC